MQPSKFRLILLLVPLALFLFTSKNSFALLSNSYSTVDSPDAIAVRIVPNPNHYNISRWYASRGFQGSPQALTVDGYEAIRDGRTVYVNATNVDASSNIYTNIYLISYNQNPAPNTVDILGQIISHWKFNNNLVDTPISSAHTLPPNCSISTLSCASDNDCSIEQKCETSGSASSTCLFKTPKSCVADADCPTNFFCDSIKAQITRDVKRAGQLQELRSALTNFKEANNSYPLLAAGTYLSNNSVSLWPSWSQIFLSDLAVSPSLIDPINRLGACPGYDSNTCWNQDTKRFVSTPTLTALTLPSGSYAFAYQVNSNGSAYNLCATMESQARGYQFSPNNLANSICTTAIGTGGQTTTTPPQLIDVMLTGEAHQPFNGFIKVASSRPLTWRLASSTTDWSSWSNSPNPDKWPILQNTSNPNQKKVSATLAGLSGTYDMKLTVTDDRSESLTTTTKIVIYPSPITITAENGEYVSGSANFNYSFTFSGKGFTPIPQHGTTDNTYSITGPSGLLPITSNVTPVALGGNEYRVTYSNITPPATSATYNYEIKVIDSNSSSATKDFSLKILPNNSPVNTGNCQTVKRVNESYAMCSTKNGSNILVYSATGLPSGLIISNSGEISGTPTTTGTFPITVSAKLGHITEGFDNFTLKVNSYCGDGVKQTLNDEGTGGPSNNGQEDCDGTSGVTTNVASSSINLQYGCSTGVGDITPYPITTNDKCSYPAINSGGGFRNDGYCQSIINGNTMETCSNSPADCGPCVCTPVCSGKVCGAPDECGLGGTCDGTCPTGETCNASHVCVVEYKSGYKDYDKDGYGAGLYGTYAIVSTYGIVISNTDCDDSNVNVHPGQPIYFTSPITGGGPKNGTYDYDCNGTINTEYSAQCENTTPFTSTKWLSGINADDFQECSDPNCCTKLQNGSHAYCQAITPILTSSCGEYIGIDVAKINPITHNYGFEVFNGSSCNNPVPYEGIFDQSIEFLGCK